MCRGKSNREIKNGLSPESLCSEIGVLEKAARRYAVDRFEAEDLVQDTLVLALRFSGSYRKGTNLRAWLLTVMRNRHVSVARRRQLERRILGIHGRRSTGLQQVGAAAWFEPECEMSPPVEPLLSNYLLDAMNRLKPAFREAVWLCDVKGLSYADAARIASCPIGTIMSRLHRGRRALKSKLGSRKALEAA